MNGYITVQEAAEKWGVTPRRFKYCARRIGFLEQLG